ncbi:CIS tube protein [Rubrolithibacter danxiaensis]|uniref:CIS tube protein n=1 Tax=Rubrolithibacter danxiaensis TaxID=3390805 RepID=UPI003BF79E44
MLDILSGIMGSEAARKLKIEAWPTAKRSGTARKVFTAFLNPDEFTLNYTVRTESKHAVGANGSEGGYLGAEPLEVTLKFYLDGTNATGVKLNVPEKIKEFYETVGYNGDIHRTNFLRITWANFTWLRPNQSELDCEFKNASIQYKLFKSDGTPLRAIITATFAEKLLPEIIQAQQQDKSADLTHVRIVKEGDTLPSMAQQVYGDFTYYLDVARVNNLVNFRDISPGQQLFFPPLVKNIKASKNA